MGLSGMACYWDHCFWLVGWFQAFPPHSCECLLDHYAETDSLGATHTLTTHIQCTQQSAYIHSHTHSHPSPSLTHTHRPTHTQTHSNLPNVSPRRQTRTKARGPDKLRNGPWEREVLQVKQILWLNCSFSIAFVQYQLKKRTNWKMEFLFYKSIKPLGSAL